MHSPYLKQHLQQQLTKIQAKKKSTNKTAPIGRLSGNRNYTDKERLNISAILEQCLPISNSEWSFVANKNREMYLLDCTVDSIEQQYQNLLCCQEPTGDPNCPPDVKQAKVIDCMLMVKEGSGNISKENRGLMVVLTGLK